MASYKSCAHLKKNDEPPKMILKDFSKTKRFTKRRPIMKRFKHKPNTSSSQKISYNKNVDIQALNPNSAGIDIGSRSHFVAIPPDRNSEIVREFSSTTSGLIEMCDWLKQNNITTAAMESTGSYWIPVYEILESRGIDVYLVNAKFIKNVPGRKTDVLDCQWIQKLHSFGLLAKSFRPKDHCLKLRALCRQHSSLIEHRSAHIQHMQKSLHEMNIQLATHIRDITGVTGMRIINAILNGERDVKAFAALVDSRCKNSAEKIAESLRGNYREEHLFTLKQARDLFCYYTESIRECEREIDKALAELQIFSPIQAETKKEAVCVEETKQSPKSPKQTKAGKGKNGKKSFDYPITSYLEGFCGVNIIETPGIDQSTALKILAELGGNVDSWKSAKHFSSWLGVCPGNKISGGLSLSGRTKPCKNRVAGLLRMAANGLWNSHCYLGAFLRRMKSRLGGPKAITATAHKLAIILYTMIKEKKSYIELGEEYYEKNYQERRLKALKRQAKEMDLMLVPIA